jgi:hypothetical protein
MPFKALKMLFGRKQEPPPPPPAAGALPRHMGELWGYLQEIAREESPEVFASKPVPQHAAESVEGKKDVERWLEIYRTRTIPGHRFRFPDHHPRHRGYCLMPRLWPSGTVWEAFDEATLFKAPLPGQRSLEDAAAALDAWLDARQAPAPS